MAMEMPSLETIASKLSAGATSDAPAEVTTPAAPANEQQVVDTAAVANDAAQAAATATSDSTAGAPTTEPSASPALKEAIEQTVSTNGIAAVVDALSPALREEIGRVLKPGMDRAMNRKDSEILTLRDQLRTNMRDMYASITDEVTELLTQGMSDEEKADIRTKQAERQKARDQQAGQSDRAERINAALEEAWSIVEDEGLPRDRTDPRIAQIDWARDEPDKTKALARIRASARAIAQGKATAKPGAASAAATAATPLPGTPEFDKLVEARAAEALDKLLIRRGLKPDTGRPGAGGGGGNAPAPKTMAEANESAKRRLAEANRI